MKLLIVFVLQSLVVYPNIRAQPRDLREGNADYVVPVPAALVAMGERAAFLEPSTVRDAAFATMWSSAQGFAAGAEFAPVLMSGIDLSDYLISRYLRPLLRARVSIAAASDE